MCVCVCVCVNYVRAFTHNYRNLLIYTFHYS